LKRLTVLQGELTVLTFFKFDKSSEQLRAFMKRKASASDPKLIAVFLNADLLSGAYVRMHVRSTDQNLQMHNAKELEARALAKGFDLCSSLPSRYRTHSDWSITTNLQRNTSLRQDAKSF
jgi:hypothetical protein